MRTSNSDHDSFTGFTKTSRNVTVIALLVLATFTFFILNISSGPVAIPASDVFLSLTGESASRETWEYIIQNYRLPKAITAMVAGAGLSVSGLLMQTLFRNPLAGPYVLGLSSGSSLGVAFIVMGSAFLPAALSGILLSSFGVVLASCIGSFVVLAAVLVVAQRLRDTTAILIVGLMFASFTGAIVGVLTFFSTAEQLQKFTFWSLGNLGNLSWMSIAVLSATVIAGLVLGIASIKPLNALLLGENYARSLGVNISRSRFLIILATSILAGSITAFAGPIAFIGLAVPHIAKLSFRTSDHRILYPATVFCGASVMLLCDMATQWPGSEIVLPINAVTSILGAPVVIWLLVRKQKPVL